MEYNETISRIIGQDLIKQQLLDAMQNKRFSVFEIIGAEGSGKKTLSNHISDIWIKQFDGVVYNLNAVYHKVPEDYSSFKTLLIQNSKTKNLLLNIFCETLKDIPHIGSPLSTIVKELTKNTPIDAPLNEYTSHEQFIISEIHKHANNKPILFICNDFDIWDLKSKKTLSALIKHEEKNIYNKTFFILNTTHILNEFVNDNIQIGYLNAIFPGYFQEIVSQFNSKVQLTDEQIFKLSELTDGNLELLKESICLFDKNEITVGKTFYNIIETHLNYVSDDAPNVLELLKQVAFIGTTVDSRLLKIFVDKEKVLGYEDILDEALRISYLEEDNYKISFVKQYIYSILKESYKNRKYYLHLSECLKILYPSRYDLQMQYLYRGNLNHEADKMFFIYLIDYYRENNVEYNLSAIDQTRLSQSVLYPYYEKICAAYKKYKTKEYNLAEEILSEVYCSDIAFRFEKDYLLSLIATNKYCTFKEFSERITALNAYKTEEFKKMYPEMYLRALMILVEFHAEIGSEIDVKKTLQEIFRCFSEYASTDKQIQCYEHCFKMKANAFYKIEIAERNTKSAYNYFKKPENKQYYLNKYYLALLNHSANQIVLGSFNQAYELLWDAYNIAKAHPYLESIHEDILLNNLLLSEYYCGYSAASDCANYIENIASHLLEPADNLLLKNNQAVFLALSNNIEKALLISTSLYEKIKYNDDIDPYYQYFITNNYAILLWLKNNSKTETIGLLETIFNINPLPQDQAYFKARAAFLKDIINQINPTVILANNNWNNYIYENHPNVVGKAWQFWSSFLLFSELQIWSDY